MARDLDDEVRMRKIPPEEWAAEFWNGHGTRRSDQDGTSVQRISSVAFEELPDDYQTPTVWARASTSGEGVAIRASGSAEAAAERLRIVKGVGFAKKEREQQYRDMRVPC